MDKELLLKEDPPLVNIKCTHLMFTNGDNYYTNDFLDYVVPAMKTGKQMIAWDFKTHHPRKYNVIHAEIKRGFIDLGAVLVTREAIILNKEEGDSRMMHHKFLRNGTKTSQMFARDYFFFQEIYDQVGKENVEIIHQMLFLDMFKIF